jgi:hypothetical protein
MAEDMREVIDQMVRLAAQREGDAIEHMCEIMLTTPNSPGVLVQRTFLTKDRIFSCYTVARLDAAVPFGQIYYLPDVYE